MFSCYMSLITYICKIFHRHLNLLYTDQEGEGVFTPGPIASFRSARKISSYLIRAKFYPLERHDVSFKLRGRCCQVCLNVTEIETFISTLLIRHVKSTSLIAVIVPYLLINM